MTGSSKIFDKPHFMYEIKIGYQQLFMHVFRETNNDEYIFAFSMN